MKLTIIKKNVINEYPLFELGRFSVKARFIAWDSDGCPTMIAVSSNWMEVKKVFFCAKKDILEIRGVKGGVTLDSNPYIESVTDFCINEEKVFIIAFEKGEKPDYSHQCFKGLDTEPEIKKGRVIVGG